jgi:UDP-glucose 4-epimerase
VLRILVGHTNSTCKELHGPAKHGEQVRSVIDASKIRQELSWEPRTELSDGLKRTIDYFRERMG